MRVCVKLPSDPLIDYLDFCRAIAEAVCPTGEKGLEGIDCVTGKLVTCHVPIPESPGGPHVSWQSVLVSDDGRTLNELLPSNRPATVADGAAQLSLAGSQPKPIGEMTLPCVLSAADRHELAKVLTELRPTLRYSMSEEELAMFMEKYINRADRPMWVPILETEATIKAKHAAVLARHQQALRQEFEAGRLTPVNAIHVPVAALVAGVLIPRGQAVSYLECHGLAYDDGATSNVEPDVPSPSDNTSQKPEGSELPTNEKPKAVGTPKVSPRDRKTAVELYWKLKGAGEKDFVAQVAQKYGVTVRAVNNWVKAKEAEEAVEKKRLPASVFSVGK